MSEFGRFELGLGSMSRYIKPELDPGKFSAANGVSPGKSFTETLQSVLEDTNESLKAADKASEDFAAGRSTDIHDLMITMEKAELSLKTVSAVRNKMIEAYQEIMRMQV